MKNGVMSTSMKNLTAKKSTSIPPSALLAASVALILWGGTAIANKVAVGYMSGLTAGVLRSMLAGLLALLIASLLFILKSCLIIINGTRSHLFIFTPLFLQYVS